MSEYKTSPWREVERKLCRDCGALMTGEDARGWTSPICCWCSWRAHVRYDYAHWNSEESYDDSDYYSDWWDRFVQDNYDEIKHMPRAKREREPTPRIVGGSGVSFVRIADDGEVKVTLL